MKILMSYLSKNKKEILLLTLLFSVAFIIRVFNLSENLFFGFEQGRDAEIIKGIYGFNNFVLTGPSTSIGGVFHGPWYYYMMAIPYRLSSGNPLAAVYFLAFIGSIVPIAIYFLSKDIFKSVGWAFFTAVLTVFSYEYILYSRWLSNVSPSPLFMALAFLFLWKYNNSNKFLYFLFFVISASLASLFQMILSFQFIFVFLFYLIFKVVKLPSFKYLCISAAAILLSFSPLIFFDFRNQHISLLSLWKFANGNEAEGSKNIILNIQQYFLQMKAHFTSSIINLDNGLIQLFILGFILVAFSILLKNNKYRQNALFIVGWILMSIILIYISPGNPQYYVGIGLGWILVFSITVKFFWETKLFRIGAVILIILFLLGLCNTLIDLNENKNVFFRTVQDDLNLFDQKQILNYIHEDSMGKSYRFIAFTVPYLCPDGWEYLKKYLYPDDVDKGGKLVYIVIEKYVASVWENKWINELGNTKLISEKQFGKLRVQKRILED